MNKLCKLLKSLRKFFHFFCGPLFQRLAVFATKGNRAPAYVYACNTRAKVFSFFFLPPLVRCARYGYAGGMEITLAFSNLKADAPRQRARCTRTGRFVAWVKAAALRVVGAPRVVVVPVNPAPPAVAPLTPVAPVVAVTARAVAPMVAAVRAVPARVVRVSRAACARVATVARSAARVVARLFGGGGCAV